MINKKIVLITSGQPALNPRLVKEADALADAGYDVIVIYQYWNEWGTKLDNALLSEKKWKAYLIGGSPFTKKFTYLKSKLSYKIAVFIARKIGIKRCIAAQAIGRCAPMLTKKASSIAADIYIAHNLAALPAAVIASKKNKAKSGFDAEDFHRNEQFDSSKNFDVNLKTYIEDQYIPKLDYISTSSPFISIAYKKLYPEHYPVTILNVFPKQYVVAKPMRHEKLKLLWFSQTIGYNRGIELIIKALGILNNPKIELHLLGYCRDEVKICFSKLANQNGFNNRNLFYYTPISPDDIFSFASKFDIGLATEIGTPDNRNICLTNKIFTYIQSGLAVLASNTIAQKQLLEEYPNIGMIYQKNSPESLAQALQMYLDDGTLLYNHQLQAYQSAHETLNWEAESTKFLAVLKKTLEC